MGRLTDAASRAVKTMDTIKNSRSLLLAARPSFLEGVARLVDVGGTLNVYNTSRSADIADIRAMRSDWYAVGDDIRLALRRYHGWKVRIKTKVR